MSLDADPPCPAEVRQKVVDGEQLWQLLSLAAIEPPSDEVLRRVSTAIAAELEAERSLATDWLLVPGGVLVGFATLLLMFGKALPVVHAWPMAAAMLGMALFIGALVMRHTATAFGAALIFSVGAAIFSSRAGGEYIIGCPAMESLAAALPLFAMAVVLFRRPARRGPLLLGSAAAVGALAGQAALFLACPGRSLEHLLVAHAGGVLVSGLLGLALGFLPVFRNPARTG